MVIIISDKINCKPKITVRKKEHHIITCSIYLEDKMIINKHIAVNNTTPKYMKQNLK